jgi:hypothetical protein
MLDAGPVYNLKQRPSSIQWPASSICSHSVMLIIKKDEFVKSRKLPFSVIPAKAGIQ